MRGKRPQRARAKIAIKMFNRVSAAAATRTFSNFPGLVRNPASAAVLSRGTFSPADASGI